MACVRLGMAIVLVCLAQVAMAAAVRPMQGHPGNIFVSGELVSIPCGAAWRLVDYEGRVVREGQSRDGRAEIGELGVGYYRLEAVGGRSASLGVLAPLAVRPSKDSPIGADTAMSWFYQDQEKEAVASLCALAGLNWVRDRLNWAEIEPEKGEISAGRYDVSARVLSSAGLRVLQVIHYSPKWANPEQKRFPTDLRDAHRFWERMAGRWKGQVEAFEPWNEADIDVFGGHTGAEMAAYQKASYLGLKRGNPEVIASLNVFAHSRPATLEDLKANEAWPYFDTCNLHHYIAYDQYPQWYSAFRGISAGRPLWTTEFSMPVQWEGDQAAQEPGEENLREQARRVPRAFAASLHEGTRAAFYFILGHYVEGKTQFGVIRRDLTPRPAYLALAATGRLLADARPAGRLRAESGVQAYVFFARPDGREAEVVVAWSSQGEKRVDWKGTPAAVFDYLGRPVVAAAALTADPVYLVMPAGWSRGVEMEPPPAMPQVRQAEASPIVLQAIWPTAGVDVNRSAYRIPATGEQRIPVFVYNFGSRAARGHLKAAGPAGWRVGLEETVEIGPGERKELKLAVSRGERAAALETIRVEGDFAESGRPVLSLRLAAE